MFEKFSKTDQTAERAGTNHKEYWKPRKLSQALAVLASIIPAEAAPGTIEEIDGRDWTSGVELMRDNVNNGTYEVSALFFINQSESGEWQTFGTPKGSSEVTLNMIDGLDMFNEYESANGKTVRSCHAHTHPVGALFDNVLAANRQIQTLSQQERIFFAPSTPDLANMPDSQIMDNNLTSMVFEVSGSWYTRLAKEADFKDFPIITEFANRKMTLRDKLYGTDDNAGLLAETLEKMSDQEVTNLLKEVGGTVERWSDLDERSDRDLSIINIINKLLQMNVDGIDLEPFLKKIGPEVTYIYNQMDTLEQQSKFVYDFTQAYAMFVNLSPGPEMETVTDVQNYLESLRPTYVEAYKEIFGHEPQLDGDLKDLLIEGMLLNGVKARFVTYDQLATEPPCVGTDYQPEPPQNP